MFHCPSGSIPTNRAGSPKTVKHPPRFNSSDTLQEWGTRVRRAGRDPNKRILPVELGAKLRKRITADRVVNPVV
jgi:hypothetical protein